MIIQSSNRPIKIKFPKDININEFPQLRVSLWQNDELLKLWEKDDIEIEYIEEEEKYMAIANLTQEETASYINSRCVLEIKWLNKENETKFAKQISLIISDRNDKEVMRNE